MTTLFHLASQMMRAGSVVEPGNWGRMLKRYQHKHPSGQIFGNPWILSRELVFEMVRMQIYAHLPSRLNANFAILDAQTADRYRAKNDPNSLQILYEVELVEPSLPTHHGSLAFTDWPMSDHFLDPMRTQALAYWSGQIQGDVELVTASALRIIKAL